MRYDKTARQVPAGLVDEDDSVCAWRHFASDLGEVKVHRLCVASWQNQSYGLALFRADGAEDVGRDSALVARCTGARAAFGPTPCDLVLLADTRLVLKPDLYPLWIDRVIARDLIQAGGEVFLKPSIAPAAWAWWRGRADSLR